MIDGTRKPRPNILEMAAATVRTGIEPPTPRWSATLAYLYGLPLNDTQVCEVAAATRRSPEAIRAHCQEVLGRRRFRQLWARVGRRGRKSSTTALIAVFEALYGGHERFVMPGERALVAVISKDLAGATVITRFVRVYLDALGIKYTTSRMGAVSLIEIEDCQLAIATLASTSDAPRGFAIPVLILDEWAHVPSGDDYADNGESILAGAEPAQAQFGDPLVVGISTGLGREGVHYERVERGLGNDSEREILSVTGASWEWSKDITPERAREIAGGDNDTLLREFEGGVSENEGTAFVLGDSEACFAPHPGLYQWGRPFLVLDPAETTNTFSWLVAAWGEPTRERQPIMVDVPGITEAYPLRDARGVLQFHPLPERPLLRISRIGGWTGEELRATTMDQVAYQIGQIAREAGADTALSDRRGDVYLAALLSPHRVKLRSFTITNDSKHEAVKFIRTLMRDRQISIIDHDGMRTDLRTFPRRITGGRFKYGEARSNQKKHWDHASLLVTLAHSLIKVSDETGTSTTETHVRIEGAPMKQLGQRSIVLGR